MVERMNPVRWGGIIAAGEGSRLASEYPGLPKPLVRVAGRPLIAWAAASLRAAGVRRLIVLLNTRGDAARDWLRKNPQGMGIRFLRRDTASSWESFRLVSRALALHADRFFLSTTDTIMSARDARRFAQEAFKHRACAALGLTRFIDDEKPFWADLSQKGTVQSLGEAAVRRKTATCGVYALTRAAARAMPAAAAHSKLREFWISLAASGTPVRGVLLSDTVDVDRPEDVRVAEKFILGRADMRN